ncbi:hypothetical protein [Cryocola sp. 340MFSha3.1]|uniref:hypothetical protein n=1 Tax=Cryocola sp. 340MFSha3.1 TaxID=1169145 RepID=UPI0003747AE6|nr:hypothetical protein [Cryocola sp. 340MFSha3.1]
MGDSAELERRVLSTMSDVSRSMMSAAPGEVYELSMEGAARFTKLFDADHAGLAYVLWMDVSDLYDHPRGRQSMDECERMGRMVARDWLKSDPQTYDDAARFFERWSRFPRIQ